jgi:hypothetical protein
MSHHAMLVVRAVGPASHVRNVWMATPRAIAHSAWDHPSRVRPMFLIERQPVQAVLAQNAVNGRRGD